MERMYRKLAWAGVGVVVLSLAVWGASQAGLTQRLKSQLVPIGENLTITGGDAVDVGTPSFPSRPSHSPSFPTRLPPPTQPPEALQSFWCPTPSRSNYDNLYWGATCCIEYPNTPENRTACNSRRVWAYANRAACVQHNDRPAAYSKDWDSYGWSTWSCSRARDDAIRRAQILLERMKAHCPSGNARVDCKLVDCDRNITLAAHAKVRCTVTSEFTPH